jgi:hypothetical protein
MEGVRPMESPEKDSIVFEAQDGSTMEFTVMHEFYHDGFMYAVLERAGAPGDTLIAQVADPMGPDEEFLPLPLARQQELLERLRTGGEED